MDTFAITASADKTIRKWDMATTVCVHVYSGHSHRIQR